MATPLPLPKNRFMRIVVVDIYVFAVFCTPYLSWCLITHRGWSWGQLMEWALIIALSSIAPNMDYYEWRNRRQPSYKIAPDRDEAQPARKAIDN